MKNILIIFCDQLRYDAVGALGNPHAQTPHIDELTAESVVFERAITPAPVCVPARLSMMAGQYPARTGNNNNNKNFAYTGDGFYGELTRAGFDSCNVGKMHYARDMYGSLGFNTRHTQEELSNPRDEYTQFIMNSPYRNVFDYNGTRSEMYYVPQVSQLPAEAHPTQWIGDRSVGFIRNHDKDKPFFLFSSFIHPHPPFCPPAPWNKLFRREDIPEPFVPDGYMALKPLIDTGFDCEKLGISPLAAKRLKNYYYACTSFVDYQVGRIVAALRERGMYDDTLIVFTADHGECLGDYRNMGKRSMLDYAAHIPFMMKVPGHAPERRGDVASLVDLAPTILSLAGVPYNPAEYDGVDLFSARHDYVFSQYNGRANGAYMIAGPDEKLVFNAATGSYHYFNEFPEAVDRYDENDAHQRELRRRLDAYIESDVASPVTPGGKKKKMPIDFGTRWMDHKARHDEEAARIPPEYRIDLPLIDPGKEQI